MARNRSGHGPLAPLATTAFSLYLVMIMAGVLPGPIAVAAQEIETTTSCTTTVTGYTVQVCLTAPSPKAPLDSDPLISATVTVSDDSVDVRSIDFDLDGHRALTDFDPPYQFLLPVAYWGDGTWTLTAVARMSDKEKSDPASTDITIATGDPMSFADASFTPPAGRPAAPGGPFVVAAIGDSASGSPQSGAVADLIGSWDPNLLLYLGDVYNSGTYAEFMNWYDPAQYYGGLRDITLPTPGNHEYAGSDQPRGYLDYWGNPPHYYSIDVAGWHIVSLDSNPHFSETAPGTPQMRWLEEDLTRSANACTLVFFHHPPHSVGNYAEKEGDLDDLWRALATHHVTLLLSGHDHNYQRWVPLDAESHPNPQGTTSLVVGTGGHSEYAVHTEDKRLATPAIRNPGALRLELNPNGAGLQFVTTDGIVRDTSVVPCAGEAADTTPPAAPEGLTAFREEDGTVSLRWPPATDDTGVDHYRVYRNDQIIDETNRALVAIDADAGSGAAPAYRVEAVDAAGNTSPPSASVTATGHASEGLMFADSFSSGSLARWSDVDGLTIDRSPDSADGHGGVARAQGSRDPAWATWNVPPSSGGDITFSTSFRILDQGDNPIVFVRLRDPDGNSLGSVNVGAGGTLAIHNDVASNGATSTRTVSRDQWHTLAITLSGSASNRVMTILLDDDPVAELSGPIDLGPGPIGAFQLGDSTKNRIYDVLFDDVVVTTGAPATPGPPGATPAS